MRRLLFLTTILAYGFVLNSCNNTKHLTSQTEVLFRNKWKLTEVGGQQVPDSLNSSFEFTPGKISGSTGCNWLSAGFLAGKHQTIIFAPDAPIKMECVNENAAKLETRFLDALSKSTKWDINGGALWLGDGDATLIKLRSL
ncbi:MAG: META domain-containing protein [Chitinophagales bacterium]